MSDKKNKSDSVEEQEWIGSFYGGPKNPDADSVDSGRNRKKISSIDRPEKNDGSLTNKRRDISALVYILRFLIILLLLVSGFFGMKVGIDLYRERLLVEQKQALPSAVMSEVTLIESTVFKSDESIDFFKIQCAQWEDEAANLRAAHELIKRNYFEKALERCNYVLSSNPSNRDALEMVAGLYNRLNRRTEAINAYVRLLNLDYMQVAVQEKLIESLYFHEDYQAVVELVNWYYEKAVFNEQVHYLLFHSYKKLDRLEEALEISNRILKSSPDLLEIANDKIEILLKLKRFNEAIIELDLLHAKRYRDPLFYRDYAACFAQLGQIKNTVEVLGKAVNIFGRSQVLSWIASEDYDKIRNDLYFETFSVRVGGQEVADQLQALADLRRDSEQVEPGFLMDENIESIDTMNPQLNILNQNQ
jgi:tetratricopeptide (TPR) repeat protein